MRLQLRLKASMPARANADIYGHNNTIGSIALVAEHVLIDIKALFQRFACHAAASGHGQTIAFMQSDNKHFTTTT